MGFVFFHMHSHRPLRRRVADWQIECIDSKWKWSLPWSVSAAALLILMVVVTSLWNHEMLKSLSQSMSTERSLEFSMNHAGNNVYRCSYRRISLINGTPYVHVGGKGAHFQRRMFYRRHLIGLPPPIAELRRRFSEVPWNPG